VGWVLWWRHSTASSTSSEFIIYSGKPGSRATVLEAGRRDDIVVIMNSRNL
jgi:hypothetical protein